MRGTVLGLIAIVLLSWVITSPSLGDIAYYNLLVVDGEENPSAVHQIQVFPNGQILDPHIQYLIGGTNGGTLAVTTDYHFLLASGDPDTYSFQILPNGNLFTISSTPGGGHLTITPNNQLVITDNGYMFSLSSTGILAYDTTIPLLDNPKVDPMGRGILGLSSLWYFSSYTINYVQNTLTMTTSYPQGSSGTFGYTFTPNGKLGFVWGSFESPNEQEWELWALHIDSSFNVTTTSQRFPSPATGVAPEEPAISPDSKYLWIPDEFSRLFTIDTLGNVTDTGKEYFVSNMSTGNAIFLQKNTPDGRIAIVEYEDFSNNNVGNFATAIIEGDGSLIWTGYTLGYNYGTYITDFVVVPVYTTSVPEELWKKLDDE